MAAYTSSSQHYQDYRDYPFAAVEKLPEEGMQSLRDSLESYKRLVDSGTPKEVARMVLPEAMGVNLIMTVNAHELAHIINVRICKRNVPEMRKVAGAMYKMALEWFPELFGFIGPDCSMAGCRQGRMSCKK